MSHVGKHKVKQGKTEYTHTTKPYDKYEVCLDVLGVASMRVLVVCSDKGSNPCLKVTCQWKVAILKSYLASSTGSTSNFCLEGRKVGCVLWLLAAWALSEETSNKSPF